MAVCNQGNSISSSKRVTAFDLEPNPFEQSFASTEKPQSEEFNERGQQRQQNRKSSSGHQLNGERNSNLTISEITSHEANVNHHRNSNGSNNRRSSPLIYGAQRPNIHSPPLLTPGGSKRLPPLLLSPSIAQHVSAGGATGLVGPHQMPSLLPNSTSPMTNPSSSNTIGSSNGSGNTTTTTESQKPSFFLNLSKTGLTPNESSIRTGFTPSILAAAHAVPVAHHQYPSLASINNNTTDNNEAGNNASVRNHSIHISDGFNNNDMGSNGVPAPFTPGLGSLLGFTGQASSRQAPQIPKTGVSAVDSTVSDYNMASTEMNPSTNASQRNNVIDPITSSSGTQHRKSSTSVSPRQQSSHVKKRKTSSAGKNVRPKKNQITTPNSSDSKQYVKREANDMSENEKDLDEDDQERKRKEFLERNRVAASKFRKRKKEYVKRVEIDLKFYESEYDDMSHALDKLCGIVHGSPNPATSTSLVSILESAVSKNDVPSSLSILTHIKQVLYETKYFQRNGRNPRREIEYPQDSDEEDRQRTDNDSLNGIRSRHGSAVGISSNTRLKKSPNNYSSNAIAASFITSRTQPTSTESGVTFNNENTTMPSTAKSEIAPATMLPVSLVDHKDQETEQFSGAVGTISTLPGVINGRQVIPLNDITSQTTSNSNSMSEIRQTSLVDLTSDDVRADSALAKYPNSD